MAYIFVHTVDLHLSQSTSLKSKRNELRSLKAELANQYGAAVSEVKFQNLRQRSQLAVVIVGPAVDELQRRSDAIKRCLEARHGDLTTMKRSLVSLEDIQW